LQSQFRITAGLGCRCAFDENGKFWRLEFIAEDIADAAPLYAADKSLYQMNAVQACAVRATQNG